MIYLKNIFFLKGPLTLIEDFKPVSTGAADLEGWLDVLALLSSSENSIPFKWYYKWLEHAVKNR